MTFDILSAFYQIGLHEESQVLTGDGGDTSLSHGPRK